jgi:hypothetical protein
MSNENKFPLKKKKTKLNSKAKKITLSGHLWRTPAERSAATMAALSAIDAGAPALAVRLRLALGTQCLLIAY